jgi:protein required for attachment to host cells
MTVSTSTNSCSLMLLRDGSTLLYRSTDRHCTKKLKNKQKREIERAKQKVDEREHSVGESLLRSRDSVRSETDNAQGREEQAKREGKDKLASYGHFCLLVPGAMAVLHPLRYLCAEMKQRPMPRIGRIQSQTGSE